MIEILRQIAQVTFMVATILAMITASMLMLIAIGRLWFDIRRGLWWRNRND